MFFIPLSNYLTEVNAKYYSREIERDWNYATRKVTLAFEIYWRQDAVNINFSTSCRGRNRVSRYDITAETKLSGLLLLETARDFVNRHS